MEGNLSKSNSPFKAKEVSSFNVCSTLGEKRWESGLSPVAKRIYSEVKPTGILRGQRRYRVAVFSSSFSSALLERRICPKELLLQANCRPVGNDPCWDDACWWISLGRDPVSVLPGRSFCVSPSPRLKPDPDPPMQSSSGSFALAPVIGLGKRLYKNKKLVHVTFFPSSFGKNDLHVQCSFI